MLGQIDARLRQATGKQLPFGGISLILVGDHGQLPPVKDKRCYDTTEIYRKGKKTVLRGFTSDPYRKAGVDVYELFTDVVFLDKVERVSSSGMDTKEAERLEEFRDMLLRSRDGKLTKEDWENFIKPRNIRNLPMDSHFYKSRNVFHLVATRAVRDEVNSSKLIEAVRSGKAAIALEAVNNGPRAASMSADDFNGIANVVHVCIGAPMMINTNLSTELGLVNGTIGEVFDILVDSDGIPCAVLLLVDKTLYRGESFCLPPKERTDVSVVAIGTHTATCYSGKKACERTNFPLMNAFAITVHKSQGSTLPYVLIDCGLKEFAVGLLFVALSRTRHPDHVAFSTVPTLERVTSHIASLPALEKRMAHEQHLRELFTKTLAKYGRLKSRTDLQARVLGAMDKGVDALKALSPEVGIIVKVIHSEDKAAKRSLVRKSGVNIEQDEVDDVNCTLGRVWAHINRNRRTIAGDGSCFFRSLLRSLGLGITNHDVLALRKLFVDLLSIAIDSKYENTGIVYVELRDLLAESLAEIDADNNTDHPSIDRCYWAGPAILVPLLLRHWDTDRVRAALSITDPILFECLLMPTVPRRSSRRRRRGISGTNTVDVWYNNDETCPIWSNLHHEYRAPGSVTAKCTTTTGSADKHIRMRRKIGSLLPNSTVIIVFVNGNHFVPVLPSTQEHF